MYIENSTGFVHGKNQYWLLYHIQKAVSMDLLSNCVSKNKQASVTTATSIQMCLSKFKLKLIKIISVWNKIPPFH